MKKFAVLLFAVISLAAPNAFAVTAEEWKADLDSQIILLKAAVPELTIGGDINVTSKGANLEAQLPVMSGNDGKGKNWKFPAITLQTSAAQDVVQNLQVFPKGQIEMTVTGLKPFQSRTSFESAELISDGGKQLRVVISQLRLVQSVDNKEHKLAIETAAVKYQTPFSGKMPLLPLLLSLQQQMGKQPLLVNGQFRNVDFSQSGVVNHVESLNADVQIQPNKDSPNVTVRNSVKMDGFRQTPAQSFAALLPLKAEIVGSTTNLPADVLKGMYDGPALHKAMAEAQTMITVDTMKSKTASGVEIIGQGWLKPDATLATGATGRFTFDLKNLPQAMTKVQQDMTKPGQNMFTQGQGLAGLMMMQGMGTQSAKLPETTSFVFDLTADGQMLLNGKDMTPLLRMLAPKDSNTRKAPQ
jgi:hypothetical protein